MVYPPALPPATRSDTTVAAGAHADDHNKIALALAAFLDELGPDLAGSYANLTTRLLGVAAGQDQAAIDAFLANRTAAEAARAAAEALVLSDLGTTDGQTRALVQNPASQTALALSASSVQLPARGYIVGDGATDDTAAWVALLATDGRQVAAPPVTSVIRGQIAPGGKTIRGVSPTASILRAKPTTAGYQDTVLAATGQRIADLAMLLDLSAGNLVTAVAFSGAASHDLHYENLSIKSAGGSSPLVWGMVVRDVDVSDVLIRDVVFDGLTFAVVKLNTDTSTQRRWRFENVRCLNGIDGLNINTPHGIWADGFIDAYFEGFTQFPGGFAGPGAYNWDATFRGHDNDYELVHIEDAASRLRLKVIGDLCNTSAGVAGSPGSPNGMVQIIGGAHDIDIDFDADLTKNTTGSPNGLVAQASAPRVSDGLTVAPYNITARGTIQGKAGCIAVYGIEIPGLRFDLNVSSPAGSPMSPVIKVPGCDISGRLSVRNPGVIMEVNDNTNSTGLDELHLTGSMAGLTAWATGFTSGRTSIPIARRITLAVPFTTYSAGDGWNDVCPAPREFSGQLSWKYQQNGAGNGANVIATGFTIQDGVITAGTYRATDAGGTTDALISAYGGPIRINAGRIEIRAYNGTPATGTLTVILDGLALA